MLGRKEPITTSEFDKGLFTKGNILVNERGHSPNCMDVKWNFDGSIQKRYGCTSQNTTAIGQLPPDGWIADAATSLTINLVSYWKMDEALGTRYDKYYTNDFLDSGNVINSVAGIRGFASYFQGESAPLILHTNSSLETANPNFTIGGWFNLTNTSTTQETILISKKSGLDISTLVANGGLELWSSGASSPPDSWTLFGSGASIARESGTVQQGTYSAKITRGGVNCGIYQEIDISGPKPLSYLKGKKITATCWAWASVASRAYIYIDDGVGSTGSSAHSGGSSWEKLSSTRTIDSSATYVRIYLYILTGDTVVYYDDVIVTENITDYQYNLYVGTDNKVKWSLSSSGTASDVVVSADSHGTIAPNTWYNIYGWQSSGIHAGISVNLSVNTAVWANTAMVSSAPITIAGQSNGTSCFLLGKVDELSLWKGTLNASQRLSLYGGGTGNTYNTGNSSYSWGMFDFGATNLRWLTVAAGSGIYASSNLGISFVTISTSRSQTYQQFERSRNVLICTSDAYDVPLYWAGSVGTYASTICPGSAPAAKIAINNQGFLILMNTSGSSGTSTGKRYFHYVSDSVQLADPWTDSFEFPSSADDEITNAFVVNRVLHVSTRYKIFKVSFVGGNPDWSYIEMKQWGYLPRTVKRVYLNDREWVVGMDWNHRLRAFDGFNEMIISNNIEGNNEIAEFSLLKIPTSGSSQAIANAEFDPNEQEYRINLALGVDSSQTTNALLFNVRTKAMYPYANQPYQAMCIAESNNKQYLLAVNRSGFVYILNTGNTDNGTPISELYTSPFIFNKVPGMVSKGGKLDLFFRPSSSGDITYQDCADFDRNMTRTKIINVQQDSKTHIYKSIDVPSTHNIFQFMLTSSGSQTEPWVLTHYDLYEQGVGVGKGNN